MTDFRQVDHDIDPLFIHRWSPRGFNPQVEIDKASLWQLFEAARWAPSAWNAQPWRFIYALKGTPHWETLFATLSTYNQSWAVHASALVLVLSKKNFVVTGQTEVIQLSSHSFDTGAAWAHLALQASLKGWHTHAIGGYDQAQVREKLNIPENYQLEAIIVIGQQGDKSHLPEALQAREKPTPRHPTSHFVAEGSFLFNE
ncbi:nitroreductase family protein [Acinetobacter baumannii]